MGLYESVHQRQPLDRITEHLRALRNMDAAFTFPLIERFGIFVVRDNHGCVRVPQYALKAMLTRHNIKDAFDEAFGVHTMSGCGPYADDVEAALRKVVGG